MLNFNMFNKFYYFIFYSQSVLLIDLLNYFLVISSQCIDQGSHYPENFVWIQDEHFNVTCRKSKIQVLNCVSDRGTQIPLMTESFWENDIEYSCMDDEIKNEEGSGQKDIQKCNGQDEYYHDHFVISCITNKFIACLDKNGDTLKEGLFLLENKQLKNCHIYSNGKSAKIENLGCFNGTEYDDIMDESLHIQKYTVWKEGDHDMRCGDVGIHIYRCYLNNDKEIYAGTAWIDETGMIHVCGE